jgi:hypothetical protein
MSTIELIIFNSQLLALSIVEVSILNSQFSILNSQLLTKPPIDIAARIASPNINR